MSGQNRLLNNQNTKAGGSYSTLSKNLLNANEAAAKMQGKGDAKKAQKKEKRTGK